VVLPIKEVCGDEEVVDECLPSSLYLTMLVIIYLVLDLSGASAGWCPSLDQWDSPHIGTVQVFIVEPGASLTGCCGVRTGGLRVSMRFTGTEEGGVVAISRTPGLGLIGIFAPGCCFSFQGWER
jgi:hypothetical protein